MHQLVTVRSSLLPSKMHQLFTVRSSLFPFKMRQWVSVRSSLLPFKVRQLCVPLKLRYCAFESLPFKNA